MTNVALIQLTNKHSEIFATFIELFLKNKWNITIYYNLFNDEYSYLPIYFYIFKKKFVIKNAGELINDYKNIDYFFWASASDHNRMPEIFKTPDFFEKSIYIQHQNYHLKDFMKKNVIVSPVINLKKTIPTYILPIFKRYKKLHYKKPSDLKIKLAIIGGIRGSKNGYIYDRDLNCIEEILNIYKNENYEFHFFMRKWDLIWIKNKKPFLNNNDKIKLFSGLSAPDLLEKLKECKFVLPIAKKNGWFHTQRLTGSIPLAINFNIPLIIDRKLSEIYNFEDHCLIYENNIKELFNDILNMKDNEYYNLIEKTVILKKKLYKENIKNFTKIFQNNNINNNNNGKPFEKFFNNKKFSNFFYL